MHFTQNTLPSVADQMQVREKVIVQILIYSVWDPVSRLISSAMIMNWWLKELTFLGKIYLTVNIQVNIRNIMISLHD